VNAGSALAPDAAMALGIASTAMPFARTPEEEAERWLRVLRLHGEAGSALQALGVSEGSLPTPQRGEGPVPIPQRSERPVPVSQGSGGSFAAPGASSDLGRAAGAAGADDRDPVAQVTEHAVALASRRGAAGVGTTDLLMAVMRIYGDDFDRVLRAHGADRGEVLERLAAGRHPAHADEPQP
jgi:hypothetical protein